MQFQHGQKVILNEYICDVLSLSSYYNKTKPVSAVERHFIFTVNSYIYWQTYCSDQKVTQNHSSITQQDRNDREIEQTVEINMGCFSSCSMVLLCLLLWSTISISRILEFFLIWKFQNLRYQQMVDMVPLYPGSEYKPQEG